MEQVILRLIETAEKIVTDKTLHGQSTLVQSSANFLQTLQNNLINPVAGIEVPPSPAEQEEAWVDFEEFCVRMNSMPTQLRPEPESGGKEVVQLVTLTRILDECRI